MADKFLVGFFFCVYGWNLTDSYYGPDSMFSPNILCEPAKPCETAHYAAFPDNRPPQLLRIYYQGMSFDTTKHREMRTYGTAPPFEQPPKITYRPTG